MACMFPKTLYGRFITTSGVNWIVVLNTMYIYHAKIKHHMKYMWKQSYQSAQLGKSTSVLFDG